MHFISSNAGAHEKDSQCKVQDQRRSTTCISLCILCKRIAVNMWERHILPSLLIEASIEHIQEFYSGGWQIQDGVMENEATLWHAQSLYRSLSSVLHAFQVCNLSYFSG